MSEQATAPGPCPNRARGTVPGGRPNRARPCPAPIGARCTGSVRGCMTGSGRRGSVPGTVIQRLPPEGSEVGRPDGRTWPPTRDVESAVTGPGPARVRFNFDQSTNRYRGVLT